MSKRRSAPPVRGKEQLSLFLETEEEAETWANMLRVTTVNRSLQLEGLNLECGGAGADEDTASGDSCETESQEDCEGTFVDTGDTKTFVRLRHPRRNAPSKPNDEASRRELLQQMLATKSLLEKKQKNRKSGAGAWAVTAGEVVNEYDRAQHEAQQLALRKAVLLRQRKNSTAIKMATLEKQHNSLKKKPVGDVALQLEALRNRLSSLDSELKESEQDTERTLQNLEEKRNLELHLIKDLGGVPDEELEVGLSRNGGSEEVGSQRGSLGGLGGSLRGSLSSIPSIVISSSERKTPEKLFGFKVGSREGKLKGRSPLHFLDLKLRVSRRHKSTECLTTAADHHIDRSHSSTPGNVSCSENSSDEEIDPNHIHNASPQHNSHSPQNHPQHGREDPSIRTEISNEALQEIEAFKQLINRYFATHPLHDSITTHPHEIIL